MLHTFGPALLIIGAYVALSASSQFRLPTGLFPVPVGWGLTSAIWPALVPAVRADGWDVAACLGATALCAMATAHASRSRDSQLRAGWWADVQRHLEGGHR